MDKSFLDSKKGNKKRAKPYVWMLLAAAIAFIFIMIRFANTGIILNAGGLPSSDVAFGVAKDFVKSTVRSNDLTFSSDGYQFAKKTDSIYVFRSVVSSRSESGEEKTVHFKVVMQFKGGKPDEMRSWDLLNISED